MFLYWALAVPTALLASVLVLLTLSGRQLSSATPAWLALWVVLSWVLFAGVMLVNGILKQTNWN